MATWRRMTEEEEIRKAAMIQSNAQAHGRRKGIGAKVWLVVSETGQSHLEEVEKQSIMRRTGLPARDLRILDPLLTYPSSILGRERAIVINLEHIKAVITAKEVLMINSSNPLFLQFVQDLQTRVSCSNGAPPQMNNDMDTEYEADHHLESPSLRSRHHSQKNSILPTYQNSNVFSDTSNIDKSNDDVPVAAAPKLLPFEFRALEACLESACRCLESETQTLEEEAYPALDALTSQISTLNLEHVRQIKSRLVALSGRVQKVRDELEHLLDDDNDMAEMYLTQKQVARTLDQSILKEATSFEDDQRAEGSYSESSDTFPSLKLDIEELECLLEAYFAQIDGALQKLSSMSDYVDDTEDCINIMLDDKQNQLLQMGVRLNTANMIINAGIVVVGLFGMNIIIPLFEDSNSSNVKFWSTMGGTVGGCIILYLIAIGWGGKRYSLYS